MTKIENKETLEEAAEKYFLKKYSWTGINYLPYKEEDVKLTKDDFIEGAKWMQERMYSEEEVIVLLNKYNKHTLKLQELKLGNSFDVKEWFEQFKKK